MIVLSPQVFLYPANSAAPFSDGARLGLAQIPSAAFGDGSHPTTRLCAVAVDYLCRTRSIAAFLDVGTGTGVLARIARARSVAWVVGTDIDPMALDAARQNAKLDASAHPILFENAAPDAWGPRFPLIVANILEEPLRHLAPNLVAALAPGGQLLLSGFTRVQVPGLRCLYLSLGLRSLSESENAGWVLMQLERPLDETAASKRGP